MSSIDTGSLRLCLETLEASIAMMRAHEPESLEYQVFRNAVVKGFELALETSGKLLHKALKTFGASPKAVDALSYKETLREAGQHGLWDLAAVERWFSYRDNRNNAAHDYVVAFAESTVKFLPRFIEDARSLAATLQAHFDKNAHV